MHINFISNIYFARHKIELESENRENQPKLYLPEHGTPDLLVHCSGGIGRSGTFLTAFHHYAQFRDIVEGREVLNRYFAVASQEEDLGRSLLDKIDDKHRQSLVSLKETVHFMRLQRHPWMVEGTHQYELAYNIILHLLKQISLDLNSGDN